MSREARARWLPPAAWAALIVLGTSWPNPQVPQVGEGDKVVHAFFYGVLGWLVARALRTGAATRLLAAFAALVAFAALDEWHQGFIPGRSASVGDLAADAAGIAIGLLLLAARRRAPGAAPAA